MTKENEKRKWAPGIPDYTEDDILEGEELLRFAMDIVWQYEFEGNDIYKVIDATSDPKTIPNIVCEISGKLAFIVVKVAAYPDDAVLSVEEKKRFLAHSAKYKAESYFAPVGLMPEDLVRANAGLLLKNDGYYIKYEGLKKVELKKTGEWIKKAMDDIRQLDSASQERVYKGSGLRIENINKSTDFDSWKAELISPTFQEMLLKCIERKGLDNNQFYKAALIDRKLFSAIKNNPDYKPKKETAVACCFGLELCLQDAEKLLELAGYKLSMAIGWDRVIYYCLQKRIYDIDIVNEILWEEGEKCIRV